MAKEKEKITQKNEFRIYKAELFLETPYVAPYLSPIKIMKKAQIARLLECYKKQGAEGDDLELLSHMDRAFARDAECNGFIPGSVLSGALRQVLGDKTIIVRGMLSVPYSNIIVDFKSFNVNGERKPMVYEYIPSGTTLSGMLSISGNVPSSVRIRIGAYENKGYGQAELRILGMK